VAATAATVWATAALVARPARISYNNFYSFYQSSKTCFQSESHVQSFEYAFTLLIREHVGRSDASQFFLYDFLQ
jgi:hypothetical protein